MPLSDETINELPQNVINEMAILEDRALCAEGQLIQKTRRLAELTDEVAKLRGEIGLLLDLATTLQEFAQAIAETARIEAARVEEQLRHFLVVQAG
jgi:hypothetical protein